MSPKIGDGIKRFKHPARPTAFCMTVTAMDSRGRIDEAGMRRHLQRLVAGGVGVYLGSGGSGEGHALTVKERGLVYKIGVDVCKGKVPIYCNPPEARSAREMLETVKQAVDAGVDVVQLYQIDAGHGRQPPVAEQEMYYRDLLEAIDYPVAISIHSASGFLAPVSLTAKLCKDYPQIKVLNLPSGSGSTFFVQHRDVISDNVKIYAGGMDILYGLPLGSWGAQVSEPNQVPNLCRSIIDHYLAGDLEKANEAYKNVLRVGTVIGMGRKVSSDGPKAALKALGHDVGNPRPPRVPVDDPTIEQMRQTFKKLGTAGLEAAAAKMKRK